MFLLDTDVFSLLSRQDRHPYAAQWLEGQRRSDLYVSVATLAEVERGIVRQRHRDPEFARELRLWLEAMLEWYGERVLPVDVGTAKRWGQLSGESGHVNVDLLIAATALENGLTVVTRNVKHFESTGVAVLDPLARSEGDR